MYQVMYKIYVHVSVLLMIVLLYNFCASKVGQNQIASVYMPYLHRSANRYAFLVIE